VVRLNGPCLNPRAEVPGAFVFAATTLLAHDEWITIDTRPGRRSVLRNGTSIQKLNRTSTPVDDAALMPGAHLFTYSGSSATGVPTASIEWAPGYPTP